MVAVGRQLGSQSGYLGGACDTRELSAQQAEPDGPLARSAARLCRMAGADPEAIPAWIEEGRRRSENARRPPFSEGRP
jgi:hypothetical protein